MHHFTGSVCKEFCKEQYEISKLYLENASFSPRVFQISISLIVLVICDSKDCSFLTNIVKRDLVPNFLMNTCSFKLRAFQ